MISKMDGCNEGQGAETVATLVFCSYYCLGNPFLFRNLMHIVRLTLSLTRPGKASGLFLAFSAC